MSQDFNGLSRRQIISFSALAGGIGFVSPAFGQFGGLGKVAGVAKEAAAAQSISDAELNAYFDQMTAESDRLNPVAGPKDPYGKRIAAISKGLATYDGMKLDIKAYKVTDINAFSMGNGTVRIFSGLMDKFTDDEIRFVMGHEFGHVKLGHSKKRMQTALRASALKKGASAVGGTVGRLADSELGDLFKKVIEAQYSQGNEKEADDYAMTLMKAKGFAPMACVTALDKLATLNGEAGKSKLLATHPSSGERSKRMKAQLAA